MLPPLFFALTLLLFAYLLRHLRPRLLAWLSLVLGLALLALVITVKVQDAQHRQTARDTELLLRELADPELWRVTEIDGAEKSLLLASTASMALARVQGLFPEERGRVDTTLGQLAGWVTNSANFPQWRRRSGWNEEVFFLAHAGAVLGNYQLATGNEEHAAAFGRIGNYLGNKLIRSQYKHLASRPKEAFFRPADNAAALYALSLYEELYGSEDFAPAYKDWARYLSDELHYAESRLPCAAFSVTNTCQLEPSAAATGLYVAYRAAATDSLTDDIPFREWQHYFKSGWSTPFTIAIRENMRKGEQTRFCELGARPLDCGRYQDEIALWAAAEYGGDYTYFRLFTAVLAREWLGEKTDYAALRPSRRVEALQEVAFRLLGESS